MAIRIEALNRDARNGGTRPISPCIKCGEYKLDEQTQIVTTSKGRKIMCNVCIMGATTATAEIALASNLLE